MFFFSCFLFQTGPKDLTEDTLGVNYRALSDLFLLAEQRRETFKYEVSVQMIEIYNEQVRDLLVADGFSKRYPLLHNYTILRIFCEFTESIFLFMIYIKSSSDEICSLTI